LLTWERRDDVQIKVGQRLRSAGSPVEVIVISTAVIEAELTCGGLVMVASAADVPNVSGPGDEGPRAQIGKRYVSERGDLELLCVKGGAGELALDGAPLSLKESKPLPSSD
jgi:hypothetical protein